MLDIAIAVVGEYADGLRGRQTLFVNRAALFLVDAFARIELHGNGLRLARIAVELRARQAERIVGVRQCGGVGEQRQLSVVAEFVRDFRIAVFALGASVTAIVVGIKLCKIHIVAKRTFAAAYVGRGAIGSVETAIERSAVFRRGPSPSAVKIWMTPPDEFPYSAENGPRSTSMRSPESRLNAET